LEIITSLDDKNDKNEKRAGDNDVTCTLFPLLLYSSYSHAPNLALGNGAAK